jgi:hypothetical protein
VRSSTLRCFTEARGRGQSTKYFTYLLPFAGLKASGFQRASNICNLASSVCSALGAHVVVLHCTMPSSLLDLGLGQWEHHHMPLRHTLLPHVQLVYNSARSTYSQRSSDRVNKSLNPSNSFCMFRQRGIIAPLRVQVQSPAIRSADKFSLSNNLSDTFLRFQPQE